MKPIKFKEANRNLLKPDSMTDEECRSLWVYTNGHECLSCWKMSWKQRLSALFFGTVWVDIFSGGTQPPIWVDCTRTVFKQEDNK
jgi:hypothetical protein